MTLIYKTGDLMTCPEKVIVHGCNAQGVMGSGVAKLVRETYPAAYNAYHNVFNTHGLRLGMIVPHCCEIGESDYKWVINAITQESYGRDSARYVSYDALDIAFRKIAGLHIWDLLLPDPALAMPKIGAGLGGGDWEIISKIIERALGDKIQGVVYELS